MKKISKTLITIIVILTLGSCSNTKTMVNNETVKTLDLERYLGTWYEIARFDHSFERGMQGVTATYTMRDDGKIKVLNKGYKNSIDGELSTAVGKAKIPDLKHPAKLKVAFFWIFYGDYFVMELDPDYKWAVIGSSSDKYLWILSRTPQISDELYNNLIEKIKNRGYNTQKLIKVIQK